MQLHEALTSTGAIRSFTGEPVEPAVVYEILDTARFAPSGGNRQGWRAIVLEDASVRRAVRDAYLDAWHDYVAHGLAGLVAFSPLADEEERRAAAARREDAIDLSRPEGFAESLDRAPVLIVVAVDLATLAATDRDLERHQLVGGASIYPFVWSILLAAREHGLGGVMTTVAIRNEATLVAALHLPANWAVAAIVALGHPGERRRRLRRRPVAEFARRDSFDGPPLASA